MAAPYALIATTPFSDGTIRLFSGRVVAVDIATGLRAGSDVWIPNRADRVLAGAGDRVYVATNIAPGQPAISIVSLTSGATLTTAALPSTGFDAGHDVVSLALSADGRALYVLQGSSTLHVLDAATGALITSRLLGGGLNGITVSPDGRSLFFPAGSYLLVVDTATSQQKSLPYAGNAAAVVPSLDGALLYVVNTESGRDPYYAITYPGDSVSVVDPATGNVFARIGVGSKPVAAVLSADGRALFVANSNASYVSRIDTSSYTVSTIPTPIKPNMLAITPNGRLLVTNTLSGSSWLIDAASGAIIQTIDGTTFPKDISRTFAASAGAPFGEIVVEFYNSALDHYFRTANGAEITDLDSGFHRGWKRTGDDFRAWRPGESNSAGNAVCRFYGLPQFGLDSHFYTASIGECAAVQARFGYAWQLETDNAFEIMLPDPATGACPPNSDPIYRVWNRRTDSNHRYSSRYQFDLVSRGWIPEGYGPQGIAMCGRH